ncbi:MAG: hypothetical protein NTX45_29850 [Proteobacteria bacterium]|nr:hypothetical protein [Pseudomonadota bacterium]
MIPILTTASTVMCPHGGQAQLITSNTEILFDGFALLQTDRHVITGCAFNVASAPSPCLTIQWVTGATQMQLRGAPLLLQNSVGLCLNAAQVPQGTAVVVQTQTQATGV